MAGGRSFNHLDLHLHLHLDIVTITVAHRRRRRNTRTDIASPDSATKLDLLAGTVSRASACVKATTLRTSQVRTTLHSCSQSHARIPTSNTRCRPPPVKQTPTSFIAPLPYPVAIPLLRPSLTTDILQTQSVLRDEQTRPAGWTSSARHTKNTPIELFHHPISP